MEPSFNFLTLLKREVKPESMASRFSLFLSAVGVTVANLSFQTTHFTGC